MINRRAWNAAAAAAMLAMGTWAAALPAHAADETPDALVKRVSTDVLETIKKDPSLREGDVSRVNALVNDKVMPYVNFRRMTSASVGPAWRPATPEQRQRLETEFKALLIRTYSGALAQVSNQTINVKPLRAAAGDTDVLVRTEKDPSLREGDVSRVNALVNDKVMPYVNFRRMTSASVGPAWRQATPEQRQRLETEFKALLIRTYSGALAQVSNQTINVKPLRAAAGDTDVLVRTEVLGRGDPVQLDYRLEKAADGWKIYNLNVLGVWLVETYRNQFSQEINARGIDGLIDTLATRSKMPATPPGKG